MYISIKAHKEYGVFKVVEVTKDNYIIDASGWEFPIPKSEAELYQRPFDKDKVVSMFKCLEASFCDRVRFLQHLSEFLHCSECPCQQECKEKENIICEGILEDYLTNL